MTSPGDEGPPPSPESEPNAPRPYQPKPPLWRSAGEKAGSRLVTVLGILAMLVGVAVLVAVLFESQALPGPATATPVTITAIESVAHADEGAPSRYVYRVRLPDGRTARFSSQRVHQPGTRLVAMVSRGWLTGRTIVAPPYAVQPDD